MSRDRVIISCPQLQRTLEMHRDTMESQGLELVVPAVVQQLGEEELVGLVPGVVGMIVGDDHVTRRVLAHADRLRVVSKWGVGIDNIDLVAAAELGVQVTNTPGMFGDEVADVVVGYLILLARRLHRIDSSVRDGLWFKPEGVSLAGKTIGIVGLGNIGTAVASRASAMGMGVLGSEPDRARAESAERSGIVVVPLQELLRESDIVSLNCPLTADNRHMINAAAIETMRPGAWLINTSRGQLVEEAALIQALESGRVDRAALDVFEEEPLPTASPLRAFDNVILGSHNASNTAEAVHRTSVLAIQNLIQGLTEVRS